MAAFFSTSAGDDVLSTGSVVRDDGGGGTVLELRSTGATITNALASFFFPGPVSSASRTFVVELVMYVANNVELVVSKRVALEGSSSVLIFLERAFLVVASLIFSAEGRFWKEYWLSMGT